MVNARPVSVLYPKPLARLWWFFRRAWVAAYEDNCFGIAKGAAYSALLSFFPVLATVTAVLVQANADAVSDKLVDLIFEAAPPGTDDLLQTFLTQQGQRPVTLLVVAVILAIWAASGMMMSLMEGFQAAYSLPGGRPFLKQRGVAAILVICAVLPLVAGSAMMLFGTRTEKSIITWLGLARNAGPSIGVALLGHLLRGLIVFVSIMLAAALLYYIGPNRRMRFANVLPGAILTSVLWLISTQVFGWYVQHIANYNVLYGSVAAVIALVVWMYVLAVVALVGCEFNAVIESEERIARGVRVQAR